MENENKGRNDTKKGLIELVEPRVIVPLLKQIKKMGQRTNGKLGKIYYGDNPIAYQNLEYEIRVDNGRPSIIMEDRGRCPAYSQTIGYELFNELFDYHLKGDKWDRRPSFKNIILGLNSFPLGGVYIEMNKGICPFDVWDAKHKFSKGSFEKFIRRLKNGRYVGAVESITDMFDNLEPAVTEFLSQYRGGQISIIKENGKYVPERKCGGGE